MLRINRDNGDKIIFLLFLLSLLYTLPGVSAIGLVSLSVIMLTPVIATLVKKRIVADNILVCVLLFVVWSSLVLLRSNVASGLYNFSLQLMIVLFISSMNNLSVDENVIRRFCDKCNKLAYILIIYNIYLLVFASRLSINYSNYAYSYRSELFAMLIIGLYSKKMSNKQLFMRIIIYAVLMFLFTERTMALGLLVLGIIYKALDNEKFGAKKFFVFVAFSIFVIAIPFLYINLYYSADSQALNLLVNSYTGKNLFSGRQVLWEQAIKLIEQKPWIGHGFGNYEFFYAGRYMSVHNTYLYLLLQGGIPNLAIVFGLFFSIFTKISKRKFDYDIHLSTAAMFMIMFLSSFGLIMFANEIRYSVMLWTTIGIGFLVTDNPVEL